MDVALHVLEVMESMEISARTGAPVTIGTTCDRPAGISTLIDLA